MHERAAEFAERAREEYGVEVDVREFDEGTKTAEDAANAIGCEVAQIASSIALSTPDGIVVSVTSGANRVSFEKIAALTGSEDGTVSMASPGRVSDVLGWSIGGVPPFCHDADVPVFVDETLTDFDEVWAAAGTPRTVFPIAPDRLADLADGVVADVAE